MSDLKAGPELDALVAEKVMGLVPCTHWENINFGSAGGPHIMTTDGCSHLVDGVRGAGCYPDPSLDLWFSARPYSTDIAAAWKVVEKLEAGICVETDGVSLQTYDVVFWKQDAARWVHRTASTLPLAICLAALKAVGHE